jgi:hypothetical protein
VLTLEYRMVVDVAPKNIRFPTAAFVGLNNLAYVVSKSVGISLTTLRILLLLLLLPAWWWELEGENNNGGPSTGSSLDTLLVDQ